MLYLDDRGRISWSSIAARGLAKINSARAYTSRNPLVGHNDCRDRHKTVATSYLAGIGAVNLGEASPIKHSLVSLGVSAAWLAGLGMLGAHFGDVIGRGIKGYQRVWAATLATFAVVAVLTVPFDVDLGPTFFAVAVPVGLAALTLNRLVAPVVYATQLIDGRSHLLPRELPETPATSAPLPRRRVAIIGSRGYPSYYGGFETLVRKLVPFLADRGWDVVVYGRPGTTVPGDAPKRPNVKSVMTKGVESRSLSTLSFGATAVMHTVTHKADVALVLNVANGFFLPALRVRGIPSVVNVDGLEWERAKWSKLGKAVFKAGAKFTARFATTWCATRRTSQRCGRNNSARQRLHSVRRRYPVGKLSRSGWSQARRVRSCRRPVRAREHRRRVPGRSRNIRSRYKVVIVGSSGHGGPLEDQVRTLVATNSNIIWTGHISNDDYLHSFWQNCGAYFHGHSVGGTNPALVQAMACGAPIVARDTVYNREVLPDGSLFVQPNLDAIVQGISTMMDSDLRRHASRSAVQRRARDLYSWEAICTAYETALINAID